MGDKLIDLGVPSLIYESYSFLPRIINIYAEASHREYIFRRDRIIKFSSHENLSIKGLNFRFSLSAIIDH